MQLVQGVPFEQSLQPLGHSTQTPLAWYGAAGQLATQAPAWRTLPPSHVVQLVAAGPLHVAHALAQDAHVLPVQYWLDAQPVASHRAYSVWSPGIATVELPPSCEPASRPDAVCHATKL